jgi:two-component system, NarL family, invasion response regulator UvrY
MKILIVDDHGVVREGLRKLFAAHFEAQIAEAVGIEDALVAYERDRPDVVVLDLNLEGAGGLEVLRRMLAADGDARIVVFSMHHEPIYAIRALKSGARGYVSKSAPVEELIAALKKVKAGDQFVDRELASRIAVSQISTDDPLRSLSTREVEILRMLGQGKSMTAISANLGIAYKTVANISTQMKVKLGVDRTADLIRLAIETLKA